MTPYKISAPVHFASVKEISNLIDEKFRKVLLLTSPTILKHLADIGVVDTLSEKVDLSVYSNVLPNAPLTMLNEIVSANQVPDCIICIGGGSVLDTGKALSVTWTANIEDYFYKRKTLDGKKIYTIAVPTTAGTGAELSFGAILEDTEQAKKGGLRGALVQASSVLIDFELYKTAPDKLMAETGFDCLTHALETYLSTASTPLVEYQSVSVIRNVFDNLPEAVNTRANSAIENMAISSALMGINLAASSTCLPHRIQYVIGPYTDTSHAQGLIMLYNGWLPIISQNSKFEKLAKQLGLTAPVLVEKIAGLKHDLGIELRLSDYGVDQSSVSELALEVTGNVEMDPCYKDTETIETIIRNSL